MTELRRVCVYAGSSPGASAAYPDAAAQLAQALAARGLGVVYGGGKVGLMGALADAALAAGAEVIGVMPQALIDREIGHTGLTELRVVDTMHERKALMADLADAFVALPGGTGTLEELVEVLTWTHIGVHTKAVGLLNVAGFYTPLTAFLDHVVRERFLTDERRRALLVDDDPGALLDRLAAWRPVVLPKWVGREDLAPDAGR